MIIPDDLIRLSLKEDIGKRDLTTELLIPRNSWVKARIVAKEKGVIAGLKVAEKVFSIQNSELRIKNVGGGIKFRAKVQDGDKVKKGQVIAEIEGRARTILTAERVALNFLQHLSGIATLTRKYVDAVRPVTSYQLPVTRIYDTRKTTPLWRELEKYAVRCGGGYNHRMNLGEMVLIKDNHLQLIQNFRHGGSAPACQIPPGREAGRSGMIKFKIKNLRDKLPKNMKIEVEAENLKQVKQALSAGVDIIMLDNMTSAELKKAVKLVKSYRLKVGSKKPEIEVSGGVNLRNIKRIAQLGIERISVGEITHSAPALDISLEIRR